MGAAAGRGAALEPDVRREDGPPSDGDDKVALVGRLLRAILPRSMSDDLATKKTRTEWKAS
jgi:hypothetical protein